MDLINEIERWYLNQCNGDWEHGHGIKIQTLDNPGWRVKIYLVETELESRPFQRLETERSENDWFHCWVKEGFFEAACGPENLEEVLEIFIEWSKKND